MDLLGWSRKKDCGFQPSRYYPPRLCLAFFGFNLWSSFQPLGAGSNILDLEDFIVSNNILPLGSLVYVLFCTTRYGWGWDNFIEEANMGKGMKFPKWARGYMMVVVPVIILAIFIQGYFVKFG